MDEVGYVGSQASKYQLKSCENIPTKFFLFSALANQNDSDSETSYWRCDLLPA